MLKRILITWLVGVVYCVMPEPSLKAEPVSEGAITPNVTRPDFYPSSLKDIALADHPRIFVTQESLPKIREKLGNIIYRKDVEKLRKSKHPTDKALVYVLWGDEFAGESAKKALLADKKIPRYGGMEKFIGIVQLAVMYDWLYPLLDENERRQVQERINDALKPIRVRREKAGVSYYLNDDWARGAAFETIAVLALANDTNWATEQLLRTYKEPRRFFSPYSGGALDTLNTLALTSGGGNQAGHGANPGTGYESMFLLGAGLFMRAWATATGENLWLNSSYFEKLPNYLTSAYLHVAKNGETARQVLEYSTGQNTVQSAALSKWLLDTQGRAKNALAFRLLIGDMSRVEGRSPSELKLPTSTYLEGADLVVSRTGWDKNDTAVFLSARHWDTSRFEPESGLLSIYKRGQPILVRGVVGKSGHSVTNTSGIWMWDARNEIFDYGTNGSTYWNDLSITKIKRAHTAKDVLENLNSAYQPQTLDYFRQDVKSGVVAQTSFSKLLAVKGVKTATRKLEHNDNTILVKDRVVADKSTRVIVGYRLVETPTIEGNHVSTKSFDMIVKSTPESRIFWSGGVGKELIGPTGKWHGKRKGGFVEGYGKKEKKVRQYGLGYLFIEPLSKAKEYHFTTELTIK